MPNKHKHLFEAYQRLQQSQQDCVLAAIIETFGSTYQKPGARMLITQQGELIGLLGGGFERDLAEQARAVFDSGLPKTVFYDMRAAEDVIWGLGLGCNGAVRVLLQRLSAAEQFNPLNHIVAQGEQAVNGVLITVYESGHADFPAGSNHFLPAAESGNGQLLTTAPFPFSAAALQTLLLQKPRLETHVVDGKEIKVFYDLIQPPLQLLVIGAGTDAQPLVHCAKTLGWRVTVVDYRPAYLVKERWPEADHLIDSLPESLSTALNLNTYQALVLMTHNIDADQRYLKALTHCSIPFIGLLGPAARRDRLLATLGAEGKSLSERLFGPVGLDIGAETPEEIALSIMAGIHSALKGASGKQLSPKPAPVAHEYLPG
jgi:xanthine dehydrogenase accessory factor